VLDSQFPPQTQSAAELFKYTPCRLYINLHAKNANVGLVLNVVSVALLMTP
jgi:hypothetical protein